MTFLLSFILRFYRYCLLCFSLSITPVQCCFWACNLRQ